MFSLSRLGNALLKKADRTSRIAIDAAMKANTNSAMFSIPRSAVSKCGAAGGVVVEEVAFIAGLLDVVAAVVVTRRVEVGSLIWTISGSWIGKGSSGVMT